MAVGIIFPGQGSQAPGYGLAWTQHPAWDVVERAEAALGEPLAHLLLDEAPDSLSRTRESQLSVLLASLVTWKAVAPSLGVPIAVAGHSLGQVTALIVAGVLSFDEGIRFAARRAEVTQAAADANPGRMAALLGASLEQAEAACAAAPGACWVANDNAPGQVVVAGTPDGVEAAVEAARAAGVRKAMALPVGGAFHTPLMQPAADAVAAALAAGTVLNDPSAPVVSNGDAAAHTDGEGWRVRLVHHLVQPVRWRSSLETLAGLGVDLLVEVGPGAALSGMAKRTIPDVRTIAVATPEAAAALSTTALLEVR